MDDTMEDFDLNGDRIPIRREEIKGENIYHECEDGKVRQGYWRQCLFCKHKKIK